jgi:ferrous iron transport protein A
MTASIPLYQLRPGDSGTVMALRGGEGFQANLRQRGIREGKIIKVVTTHPIRGPMVLRIDNRETTIGRGMAQNIMVQVRNI